MEKEKRIKKALKALTSDPDATIASSAREFGIEYSTLYRRFHQTSIAQINAHPTQMVLTPTEETAIVEYIGRLTLRGFPPVYPLLTARIEAVRKERNPNARPLGKNYLTRFIKRHPELGAGYSTRKDKKRVLVNTREIYEAHFDEVSL